MHVLLCVCISPIPLHVQVLAHIDEKKAELEEEQAELSEYQALDKQRRAMEYVSVDHELGKVKEALEALEGGRMKVWRNCCFCCCCFCLRNCVFYHARVSVCRRCHW